MGRRSAIERIAAEFAEAVAAGDLRRADGWASAAFLSTDGRAAERSRTRPRRAARRRITVRARRD